MAMRVLQQILLDTKSDYNILAKSCYFSHYMSNVFIHNVTGNYSCDNKVLIGYFSNERRILKTSRISLHRQLHTKLFGGSLLCNNKTALAKTSFNSYSIDVNSIRYYTNLPPVLVNDAVTYNTGLFRYVSESFPVELATELFRLIHYQIDLPWWLTIVLTTVIARTLINFPLTILDIQNRAKQESLKGELQDVAKRLKMQLKMEVQTAELTSAQAAIYFKHAMVKEQKELFVRENCHPFRSVAFILIQAPVWISFSVAVRNMCFILPYRNSDTMQDYIGLVNGGFGWIQNLTQMDPMFVLPIVFGLCSLTVLEINDVLFNVTATKTRRILKNVFRAIIVCLMPIMAYIPSGISLYWVTNNFCALVQNLILLSPKFRRLVRIRATDSEVQYPYVNLTNRILGRSRLKKLSVKT